MRFNNSGLILASHALGAAMDKLKSCKSYKFETHSAEQLRLMNSKDAVVAVIDVECGPAFNGYHLYTLDHNHNAMHLYSLNLGASSRIEALAGIGQRTSLRSVPVDLDDWLVEKLAIRLSHVQKAAMALVEMHSCTPAKRLALLTQIQNKTGIEIDSPVFDIFEELADPEMGDELEWIDEYFLDQREQLEAPRAKKCHRDDAEDDDENLPVTAQPEDVLTDNLDCLTTPGLVVLHNVAISLKFDLSDYYCDEELGMSRRCGIITALCHEVRCKGITAVYNRALKEGKLPEGDVQLIKAWLPVETK